MGTMRYRIVNTAGTTLSIGSREAIYREGRERYDEGQRDHRVEPIGVKPAKPRRV